MKLTAPAPTAPRLHPNLAELYRTTIQTLQEALSAKPSGAATLEAARVNRPNRNQAGAHNHRELTTLQRSH